MDIQTDLPPEGKYHHSMHQRQHSNPPPQQSNVTTGKSKKVTNITNIIYNFNYGGSQHVEQSA